MNLRAEDYSPSPDPFTEFQNWFTNAKNFNEPEPTAMSLATMDADQKPRVRIVLCKQFDANGFCFFTNYESNKSIEMEKRPLAAVCFHWKTLDLQVRSEGRVQKVSRQESEAYFNSRPRESQIGAWASSQSRVLNSRKDLMDKYKEYEAKFAGKTILCPPFWGGYRLVPDYFEFWIGLPGRLHNRFQYLKDKKLGWSMTRLYP
jgi:pyridoxamine 5'-phosphate oxidase